jgi:arylsulfatase A-like enzyme
MPRLPHIVIFNPDQWRWDVMGHLGNPAARTPTLDRMVREDSVSFSQAFCQNTVCTPSRCSFMTGWYPHVRGHRTMFHMLHPEREEPNLLAILRAAGYHVWWGGKNDLVPGQDGYDRYCDTKFEPTAVDYARWDLSPRRMWSDGRDWRGAADGDSYYSFFAGRLDKGRDRVFCDGDWANVLGAIDLIDSYDCRKPLCIYLPLTFPHPPYAVEEPWYSAVDRGVLPPRAPTPEGRSGKPAILEGIRERQRLQSWTEDRWTELRAVYYGMCSRLDHQLGLLTDALRRARMYEETALFVFSDHGDFTGDYGLVEKTQNTFEDALSRVPLVVKPPTSTAVARPVRVRPRVTAALAELVDFSATVFELAGIDPGYTSFGRSLLPVLSGESDEHRDAVFCEGGRLRGERQAMELESSDQLDPSGMYWPRISLQTSDAGPWHTKAAMCRTGAHKYVRRLYEPDELYDLSKDPRELVNQIDNPAYAPVLAELRERLLRWYMETCDEVPLKTDRRR